MFILVPITIIHPVTGKEDGETIAVVPLDLISIKAIKEDQSTKLTIIEYKSGDTQNINIPFHKLVLSLHAQNLVNFVGLEECLDISNSLAPYFKTIDTKNSNNFNSSAK